MRSGSHTLTALQLLAIFNVLKDVGGKVNLIDLRSSLLEVLRKVSAKTKIQSIKRCKVNLIDLRSWLLEVLLSVITSDR